MKATQKRKAVASKKTKASKAAIMTEWTVPQRAAHRFPDGTTHRFPDHGSTLLRRLQDLRRQDILCDVTVNVEGKQFRCHKVVLAVCSGYFHSLFTVNDKNTSITLPGMSASVVEDILNYMYTGELRLETQQVTAYLRVASFLEIPAIIELCDAVYKNTPSQGSTASQEETMRSSDRNLFTAFGAKAPMCQSAQGRNVMPDNNDFSWNFVSTSEGQIAILKDVEGDNVDKVDGKQSSGDVTRGHDSHQITPSQHLPQEGSSLELLATTDGNEPAKNKVGKRKTLKKFKWKDLRVKLVPLYSVKKKTQESESEREENQQKELKGNSASCSLETVEISKWVDTESIYDEKSRDFLGRSTEMSHTSLNLQPEEQCALNSVGEVSTQSTSEDSRDQDFVQIGTKSPRKPRFLKIDVASLTGGGKRRIKREPDVPMNLLSSPGCQYDINLSMSSGSNSSPEPTVADPLGKRRTCRICLITFRNQEEKSLHLQTVHFDPFTNKWQCPYCDNNYTASNNLQKHCVKEHGLPPSAPKGERCRCLICHARFDSQEEKTRHLHAEHYNQQAQKWECPFCSHSYTANNNLKKHCNKVHYKLCLVECPVCGKELKDKQRLKEHMYSHTGEKPYVCATCSKRFTCHTGLKRHILLHTGERPFHCDVCNDSFRQKRHLKEHMLRHSDAKPYQCETCGQQFRHSTAYRNHRYQHTNQRPWLCKLCGAGFIKKINIRRHLTTKHGIVDVEDKGQGSNGTSQVGSEGRNQVGSEDVSQVGSETLRQVGSDDIGQVGPKGIGQAGSVQLTNDEAAVLSVVGGDFSGLDSDAVAMETKGQQVLTGQNLEKCNTVEQREDVQVRGESSVGMGKDVEVRGESSVVTGLALQGQEVEVRGESSVGTAGSVEVRGERAVSTGLALQGQESVEVRKDMLTVADSSVENMFEAINPWGK